MNSKNKATLSFSWPLELIPFVVKEKLEGVFQCNDIYFFLCFKLQLKLTAKDINLEEVEYYTPDAAQREFDEQIYP